MYSRFFNWIHKSRVYEVSYFISSVEKGFSLFNPLKMYEGLENYNEERKRETALKSLFVLVHVC